MKAKEKYKTTNTKMNNSILLNLNALIFITTQIMNNNILQWNCQRFSANVEELSILIDKYCYVPTQLFLALYMCVFILNGSPVAIFRTGFSLVEYCSGSFRPFL